MFSPFFHLLENPFGESPDPRFFYNASPHKTIFRGITENIRAGKGLALICGEVGTGKTLLIRKFIGELEDLAHTAVLLNPLVGAEYLLREILIEFGLISTKQAETLNPHHQLQLLNQWLVESAHNNKRCVLFVDEAQLLSRESLEVLRLLTNLETDLEKLLQVVIFAQPEILTSLKRPDLRQLTQRLSLIDHLQPLSLAETEAYIYHRVEVAGAGDFVRFEPKAIQLIYKHSKGLPRLVNGLCERALLVAEQQQVRRIGKALIAEVKAKHRSLFATQSHGHSKELDL